MIMRTLTLFFFIFSLRSLYCQTETRPDPATDSGWFLIPELSDEFSDPILDETKWNWSPPWGDFHGVPTTSLACLSDDAPNLELTDGKLILRTTNDPSTCERWDGTEFNFPYTTGALYSVNTVKYGYFEIRIRIPHNVGEPAITEGFGANFWTWPLDPYPTGSIGDVLWSEIDFFEIDAGKNKYTCNAHYLELLGLGGTAEDTLVYRMRNEALEDGEESDYNLDFSEGEWKILSGLWSPDQISFWIGDLHRGTSTVYTQKYLPQNLIINTNVPAANHGYEDVPETSVFPYEYEIDYVRVYQLEMDCTNDLNVCSFWFGGYDNGLKKSITIGDGGCGNVQPISSHLFLRATDFVELNGNFEVPLGSELTIETGNTCYDE